MHKTNKGLVILSLAVLSFFASSCSQLKSYQQAQTKENQQAQTKKDIVNLPNNVKSGDQDIGVTKDSSMVIALSEDNKIYQGEELISKEQLIERLKKFAGTKNAGERVVYFKGDVKASPDAVIEIFKAIRDAKIDKVELVVSKSSTPDLRVLEIDLPPDASKEKFPILKPNPLYLLVFSSDDGKLKLNNEEGGTVDDTVPLQSKLSEIFKDREKKGVFVEKTNEVEKTVFVRASKLKYYGNLIKVIDAVKTAGANPIKIELDEDTILTLDEVPTPPKKIVDRKDLNSNESDYNGPLPPVKANTKRP